MGSFELEALIGALTLVFFGGGALLLRRFTQTRRIYEVGVGRMEPGK